MFKNLFSSASYNEYDLLDQLLESKFDKKRVEKIYNSKEMDINWEDEEESLLHICVENNRIEAVRWLLRHKADINKEAIEKKTPIFYALEANNMNIFMTLIENNANINHLNEHKRSLAQEAVISSNDKMIDFILKRSSNLNNCDVHGNNLIFDAVANGKRDLIEKVSKLNDVDINHINNAGNSVLQMQSVSNNKELAKFLMQLGVDPTLTDATGKNFLFYAISKGVENLDIIEEAVSLGCDINSRSVTGENLLHEAVEHYIKTPKEDEKTRADYKKIIEQLLLRGIDIDASNDRGENVLFELVRAKEIELIEFLLNEQIYLNQKNNDGDTVLSILVVNGSKDLDLVHLLLRYNLNPDIQNNLGESAVETIINIILHIENRRKLRIKVKKDIDKDEDYLFLLKTLLRESKVDLKQLNSKGEPLFFEPLLYFNTNIFQVLKDHGINLNMKDQNGNNILYALMEHNKNNKIRNKKKYLTVLLLCCLLYLHLLQRL